jgi:hypothetical protein
MRVVIKTNIEVKRDQGRKGKDLNLLSCKNKIIGFLKPNLRYKYHQEYYLIIYSIYKINYNKAEWVNFTFYQAFQLRLLLFFSCSSVFNCYEFMLI